MIRRNFEFQDRVFRAAALHIIPAPVPVWSPKKKKVPLL